MSSMDLGTAHADVVIDYNGDKLNAAIKQLDLLTESSLVSDQALSQVGGQLTGIGNIGKDALASAIGTAADFEQQLSNLGAVGGKDALNSMDAIRETALRLGSETAFSTSEAAAGMTELVKAGLPVEDVLNGAADASLQLAAATGVGVPEAAALMATSLNIFGDSMTGYATEGEKAVRIADLLAQTANASATDVTGVGEALKQVANVADSFGVSIDETTQAIGLMADAGLSGSDAGTSLKTALLSLLDPTAKQSAAMSELGLSYNDFYNADGSFKGMANLAETLQTSMSGLTDQQKQNALAVLFGADAYRAAKILADAGAEGFENFADRQAAAGTVAEQAAIMMDNFNGKMSTLRGSVETLAIKIGSVFLPALSMVAEIATMVVNAISNLPGPVLAAAAGIIAIGSAGFLAVGGFMILTNQIVSGITALKAIKPAADVAGLSLKAAGQGTGGLASSFKSLLGASGPLLIALAVIAALVVAYKTNFLGFADAVNAVVAKVKEFGAVFGQAFASFQERGFSGPAAALAALGNAIGRVLGFGDLGAWFVNAAYAVQAFGDRIKAFVDNWNYLWDIFSSSVSNGNPISDFFETLGYTLDHVFGIDVSGVFVAIANGINAVISTVGAIIQAFKDFRDQGLDPIAAAVAAFSKVFSPIAGVFEYIGGQVRIFIQGLVEVYNGFKTLVDGIVHLDLGKVLSGLGQIFAAGPKTWAKLLMGNLGAIWDVFVWLGTMIGQAIMNLGASLWTWMSGLATQALDAVRNADWGGIPGAIADAIGAALGNAGDFLRGVFDRVVSGAKKTALDLGNIAVNIKDWIAGKIPDFMNWLMESVTKLKNAALSLPDIAVNIGNWLVDSAKDFGQSVMDFIGTAAINIGNVAASIGAWIVSSAQDIWATILGWIGNAGVTIQKVAANIAAWAPSAVTSFASAVLTFIGDAATAIGSFAVNIGSWAITSAVNAITAIKNFIFGDGTGDQIDLTTLTLNIGGFLLGTLTGLATLASDLLGELKSALESALPDVDFSSVWTAITDTLGSVDFSVLLVPFEALATALSTVYHTFSAVAQQIGEWMGTIASAVSDVPWTGVFDGLASAVSTVYDSISNLAANISGWFGDIATTLESFNVPEPLIALARFFQDLFSAVSNLAGTVGSAFAALTSGMDEAEKSAVWQGFQDSISSLSTAFNSLKNALSSIASGIGHWIDFIMEALSKISIPDVLQKLVDLLGKVKDFIFGGGDQQPTSDQVAQNINDQVSTALGQQGDFGTNLVGLLAEAVNTADWSSLSNAITVKLQQALNTALSGSGAVASPGLGGGGGAPTGLGALIVDSVAQSVNGADWSTFKAAMQDKLYTNFYDAWAEGTDSITTLFTAWSDTVLGPFVDSMVETVTTGLTTLTTNITGKMNDIVRIVTTDTGLIETQFSEMATNIDASATTAMTNFNTAITSGMEEAATTIADQVGAMMKSVDDAAALAEKSGANFAEGYARGIASGTDAVTKAAADLAAAAIGAIQKKQEEGSPSRVTMESGKWFSEGYAIGIIQNSGGAKDAASALFDAAYAQLSGGPPRTGASQWQGIVDRVTTDMAQRSSALDRLGDMTIEVNTVIDDGEMGRYVIGKTIAPLSLAAERVGNRRQRY